MITCDIDQMGINLDHALNGRAMLCRKADVFPVECVVRGYIAGSGWKDYQSTGSICGVSLPPGLKLSHKLSEPIFTPATKAKSGHDENISFTQMESLVGSDTARKLRDLSISIYTAASAYSLTKSIIIADTKFEFGLYSGEIMLVDEVLTPDSSRFWPAEGYREGANQPSFDKQFVRDYLEQIKWSKSPPAPHLPIDIIQRTSEKYLLAYKLITGTDLPMS
jgi:phosphoribosylaminoimidazole-succinocarboxamide synthase